MWNIFSSRCPPLSELSRLPPAKLEHNDCAKTFAFILGTVSHQMADVPWHGLSAQNNFGLIQSINYADFGAPDHYLSDPAHSVADMVGDAVMAVLLRHDLSSALDKGHKKLFSKWFFPQKIIFDAWTLCAQEKGNKDLERDVKKVSALHYLEGSLAMGALVRTVNAVCKSDFLSMGLLREASRVSPALVHSAIDFSFGGIQDLVQHTVRAWIDVATGKVGSEMRDGLTVGCLHRDFSSFSSSSSSPRRKLSFEDKNTIHQTGADRNLLFWSALLEGDKENSLEGMAEEEEEEEVELDVGEGELLHYSTNGKPGEGMLNRRSLKSYSALKAALFSQSSSTTNVVDKDDSKILKSPFKENSVDTAEDAAHHTDGGVFMIEEVKTEHLLASSISSPSFYNDDDDDDVFYTSSNKLKQHSQPNMNIAPGISVSIICLNHFIFSRSNPHGSFLSFNPIKKEGQFENTAPVLVIESEETGDNFGSSLACVDMNGDGVDDLIVGAPAALGLLTGKDNGENWSKVDDGFGFAFEGKDIDICWRQDKKGKVYLLDGSKIQRYLAGDVPKDPSSSSSSSSAFINDNSNNINTMDTLIVRPSEVSLLALSKDLASSLHGGHTFAMWGSVLVGDADIDGDGHRDLLISSSTGCSASSSFSTTFSSRSGCVSIILSASSRHRSVEVAIIPATHKNELFGSSLVAYSSIEESDQPAVLILGLPHARRAQSDATGDATQEGDVSAPAIEVIKLPLPSLLRKKPIFNGFDGFLMKSETISSDLKFEEHSKKPLSAFDLRHEKNNKYSSGDIERFLLRPESFILPSPIKITPDERVPAATTTLDRKDPNEERDRKERRMRLESPSSLFGMNLAASTFSLTSKTSKSDRDLLVFVGAPGLPTTPMIDFLKSIPKGKIDSNEVSSSLKDAEEIIDAQGEDISIVINPSSKKLPQSLNLLNRRKKVQSDSLIRFRLGLGGVAVVDVSASLRHCMASNSDKEESVSKMVTPLFARRLRTSSLKMSETNVVTSRKECRLILSRLSISSSSGNNEELESNERSIPALLPPPDTRHLGFGHNLSTFPLSSTPSACALLVKSGKYAGAELLTINEPLWAGNKGLLHALVVCYSTDGSLFIPSLFKSSRVNNSSQHKTEEREGYAELKGAHEGIGWARSKASFQYTFTSSGKKDESKIMLGIPSSNWKDGIGNQIELSTPIYF